METIKIIARNSGILFVAQLVSYFFGLFYVMYTARYLGAEGFGILSFALSFSGIFGVFTDLGLDTLTVREVARDKSLESNYLGNISAMKIILSILTFSLIALTVNLLSYPAQTIKVVYIIAFSVIAGSFSRTLYSIFRANEKMEYESFGQILSSLLMLSGALIAIKMNLNIIYFAFIYLIVSVISLSYSLIICFMKFRKLKPAINWLFWESTIKEALPFGLTGVFVTIYYWIDTVMLSLMKGDEAVGLYNVSYRLIMVLLFIPSILNVTLFPAMSRFYISSKDSLMFVYEKYFRYMAIIGFPIGVGTTMLANRIIPLIFGTAYNDSVIALQILVWSSVFIFLSGSFGRLLESSDRQIIITIITGICAVENVLLNLIMIPRFSYVGASAATVITEFTALILCIAASSKILHMNPKIDLLGTIKPILASLLMGIFISYLNNLNLLLLILLSILLYFSILYLIKGFEETDIVLFKSVFQNRIGDRK